MVRITVSVDGMQCGMCEAHVCDAVRGEFAVKKVRSSRKKGETVILCDRPIPEEDLRRCIEERGYTVLAVHTSPYEKKGLFSRKEQTS